MTKKKHHILVIDDDEAHAKSIVTHLRKYRTTRRALGQAGLDAARADLPDLIVLDHYLPDMSGEDVLKALRADAATQLLPVIYLTSDGSHQRVRKSMTGGADDFLAKPFKPRELNDAVEAQLRKAYWRMAPQLGAAAAGSGADEVQRLAGALKSMQSQLAEACEERWRAQLQVKMLNASIDHRLAEKTREMANANQALRAYGYSVAHELKRPLSGILGYADLLLAGQPAGLDDETMTMLGRIEKSGRRMSEFIDALLDMADAGRNELRREPVDLSAMVIDVVQAAAPLQDVPTPEVRIATGLVAQADPVLLRIALENLISNAFKYTAKTTRPTIEFGQADGPDGQREFFVRDNGAGFDMGSVDRLFEPFQRLQAADEFDGLGIGLATVQRIIERHGGRVRAQAAVRRGATFFFTLE